MNTPTKIPLYVKVSLTLIALYVFISMLSLTRSILVPFLFAVITAIAISPAVNFLIRKKINRALSIALVLFILLLVVGGLIAFLSSQAGLLTEALPHLTAKFELLLNNTIAWASECFNVSPQNINAWLANLKAQLSSASSSVIGNSLTAVGEIMAALILIPVYIFMLLFYQPHLVESVHRIFGTVNNNKLDEVLTETRAIIQSYLGGLLIEFAIVATLNSIGLLILGIDYAILLGISAGLLNVVPYLGGIIGVAIFMLIALVTKPAIYVLYVVLLYSVIQFVDNNYIVPKIVGSKVKLNALLSLLAVLAGAALWGVPGMFLSIPIMAIVKLICDRIDSLKPLGFLLGETETGSKKTKFNFSLKKFIQSFTTKK
ncbi:MAG: AI-2E family transporter [Bacteroidota bacterium]